MSRQASISRKKIQQRRQKQKRTNLIVVGSLLVLAVGFVIWPRPEPIFVSEDRLSQNPSKGEESAKVVITEFGDFGCSACRSWYQAGILDQILLQYDGVVRLEWKDFPVITARSPKAAQAGQCAFDQDRFWEFHDGLYGQSGRSVDLSVDTLKLTANNIGLDTEVFDNCLDSGQHQATVDFDLDEALALGLPGTPGFLVNGQRVVGANPDILITAIERALANTNK